jgi:signal transduction histidine kinase
MANVQVHANRIAMGFASAAVKNIDLCALAKDVVDVYQPLAAKKGIDLIADCCTDRVRVTTSPTKARAVLDNLCSNALEYCEARRSVKVSVQRSRNEIRLIVEDTGPGIRADIARRFSKGELSVLSPHGSEGRGLGMGLAIVQDYAQDLKWNCSLTTEKGIGTKFVFVIPSTILRT